MTIELPEDAEGRGTPPDTVKPFGAGGNAGRGVAHPQPGGEG